mgnify:CR=1 FL=1
MSHSSGGGGTMAFIGATWIRTRTADTSTKKQSHLNEIRIYQYDSGVFTLIATKTFSSTTASPPLWSKETYLTFRDDDVTGEIYFYLNGVLVCTFTAADLAAMTVPYTTVVGFAFNGNQDGSASPGSTQRALGYGGRIVRRANLVTPPANAGSTDIVAVTSDRLDVGTLNVTDLVRALDSSNAESTGVTGLEVIGAVLGCEIAGMAGSGNLRNYVFLVDGVKPTVVETIEREVTAVTAPRFAAWNGLDGTSIPAAYITATTCCAYRLRIVLAALNKLIMTKTATPTGATAFDLVGGAAATRAYELTLPDVITALIPWQEKLLIIGCGASVHIMREDPGLGGSPERMAFNTGIVGPRAWCLDERGALYFVGSGGLYKMTLSDQGVAGVEEVVNQRHPAIQAANSRDSIVQLAYDALTGNVCVFITPRTSPTEGFDAPEHYVLDTRRNALWPVSFPLLHGPYAVCQISGADDQDRRFVFGGLDSWIRRPDDSVFSDDGENIYCEIRLPTLERNSGETEQMVTAITFTGTPGSGATDWQLRTDTSSAAVNAQAVDGPPTAMESGTIFTDTGKAGGRQWKVGMNASGAAFQIIISQDSGQDTVGFERITVEVEDVSGIVE